MSCPINELHELQQFLRKYCKRKKLSFMAKEIFREYLQLNRKTSSSTVRSEYPHILREIKFFIYLNKNNGAILQERKHKWKIVNYIQLQFEWNPRQPHKLHNNDINAESDPMWVLDQYPISHSKNEIDYLLDEIQLKQNLKTPTDQT